jgi:acetyl-CoA carboxylase carboxyl transferase subunit beta
MSQAPNPNLTPAAAPAPAPPAQPAPANRAWQEEPKAGVPEGLWLRCPGCAKMEYKKLVAQNLHVCPDCEYHFRIGADERSEQLCDPGSFEPMWEDLSPVDALGFVDSKPYKDRIKSEAKKSGHKDALLAGKGFIKGRGVVLACMDNRFMMGSMGSVVGEKVTRAIELAIQTDRPLIVVCCSRKTTRTPGG